MLKNIGLFLFAGIFLHFPFTDLDATASEINLPRSGQTTSFTAGDDGSITAGLPLPAQRFTAVNGKVTDNLTGLVWLQNANCTEAVGGISKSSGNLNWNDSLVWCNNLASGKCGLTDGSMAGQWRLPTRKELQSLNDLSRYSPALPAGHPFSSVQTDYYWSSTAYARDINNAWLVNMNNGVVYYSDMTNSIYVWPVSGGQ